MSLRIAAVLATVILASCSRELSRADARNDIQGRFDDAGLRMGEYPWAEIAVDVEEILRPTDANRTVRFRIVSPTMSSRLFNIGFVRSDAGWSMTDLDSEAVDLVTSLVLGGRVRRSSHLIIALEHLGAAAREWRTWDAPPGASAEEVMQATERLLDLSRRAPPRAELARLAKQPDLPELARRSPLAEDMLSWGVFPSDDPLLIWVRDARDKSHVCIWPFGEDRTFLSTEEFAWMESIEKQCILEGETFPIPGRNIFVEQLMREGDNWLDRE